MTTEHSSNGSGLTWRASDRRSLCCEPFALMGVLNVTPDSFSDGGLATTVEAGVALAVERGERMIAEGATIIDVGGESTRPGAARVDADEQRRRTMPVIASLRARHDVVITIDTTLAAVARGAFDAGADAVNDVSAGTDDEGMLPLIARRRAGVILMHRMLPPEHDRYSTDYRDPPIVGNVVGVVRDALLHAADRAMTLGIERDAIVLDPGLGFGKTVEQNWELIARSSELASLGFPLLIGASRKSFIGQATNVTEPNRRVIGSVIAAAVAWAGGATIIRTHDVQATREALRAMQALTRGATSYA